MNALLTISALAVGLVISLLIPDGGAAVLFCTVFAGVAIAVLHTIESDNVLLLRLFLAGLLLRMLVGALIYQFKLQNFFGGDAITYDDLGYSLLQGWMGQYYQNPMVVDWSAGGGGWGMVYAVAAIYYFVGRNMLAVQFFNAVLGAATAPVIYLCALHIFQNTRVARIAAIFVAFYPSLVLWSSQGLKDGPIIFLLALTMLATLKLGERFSFKNVIVLIAAVSCLLTFRFYIFYMVAAAVGGAFLVGMRPLTSQSLVRQMLIVVAMGLALTWLGVLRGASARLEAFGNLEAIQRSRANLAQSASSGFGQDVDVSTTAGALSAIPIGMVYLLFAPFPWQLANLRQSITLPEMLVWWTSFPLLVLGGWFTIKYRLRQALPIMIFTSMLTLAYSVFQGNVGTAYRQRAQVLIFYFIFVAVGYVLLRERREERQQQLLAARRAQDEAARAARARRYERWKHGHEKELEEVARGLAERIDS